MIGGLNEAGYYQAVLERNKKYDGIFYFATKATKLYCRPSCAAPHQPLKDYRFFATSDKAILQGYRACKCCRPDRLKNDLSVEILKNINAGAINDKGVHGLADALRISERHLRRLVYNRTGTTPTHLNQVKRLSSAKRLIVQTKLPIIDIAFMAEFSSLRQFNQNFKDAFKTSPRAMRKAAVLSLRQKHASLVMTSIEIIIYSTLRVPQGHQ